MGVSKDKRVKKEAAEARARLAETGTVDDPVVAVWFRTKSGDMLAFDLNNGKDVDRVFSLMMPVLKPEQFRFSQILDFIVDGLTFMWLVRLVWAFIGVILMTILNILGWILFGILNGAKRSPGAMLRGLRRMTISMKWAYWRKFVSVRIGRKWARKVGKKLHEERLASAPAKPAPKAKRKAAA